MKQKKNVVEAAEALQEYADQEIQVPENNEEPVEAYSDWSARDADQKEEFLKAIVVEIFSLIAKNDYPTVFTAHPKDIDEIKAGLLQIDSGSPEYNEKLIQTIDNMKWIGMGDSCRMHTMQQEREAKVSQFLNKWVQDVGLLDVAQQENVPLELLQHKDVLVQIFCSWIASKIAKKKILTLGDL